MDVMSLPEEEARSLGARTTGLRLLIVAAATLVTARERGRRWHRGLGGAGGAAPRALSRRTVVRAPVADLGRVGRRLAAAHRLAGAHRGAPVEIPLGILTALIGSPFFIVLLRRASRGWT
jgi:iron complex transport system permease protein